MVKLIEEDKSSLYTKGYSKLCKIFKMTKNKM